MSRGHLVIVAQHAPPSRLIAARRTAGLAKYLGRLGYEVTVLTSRLSGEGALEGATTIRTRDLMASGLNWRSANITEHAGSGKPSRLQSLVVPDLAAIGWLPFARSRALRLAREQRVDAVITSSPPESAHFVGLALRRRGIPWVADFRDGWTYEPPQEPWPLAPQRALDGALERRVVTRADAVVAVTDPIARDLSDRLGAEAEVITNGFDPDDASRAAPADDLLDSGRRSLVHTGRMAAAGVSPRPLVEGVRLLVTERPALRDELEVVLAGPLAEEEREFLDAPDLHGLVRSVGFLERERALGLQHAADGLLVVTAGGVRQSVATGKLFEYLAAGKPVLVLGEDTAAARIAEESGAGIVTSANDPEAIARGLAELLERREKPDPARIERFGYPALAERYAGVIERARAAAG